MAHVAVSEEPRRERAALSLGAAQPVNVTGNVFIWAALIRFHIPGARLDNVPAALPRSLVPERLVWKWFSQQPACVCSPRSGDWHFYDSAHPRQRQRGPRDSSEHHAHHHMQVNVRVPRLWDCLRHLPPSEPTCSLHSLLLRQLTSCPCCVSKNELWVYEFQVEFQNCCESVKN